MQPLLAAANRELTWFLVIPIAIVPAVLFRVRRQKKRIQAWLATNISYEDGVATDESAPVKPPIPG